ncbi:MAG: hypothetical protein IKE04_05770 [Oscillospiraceae bacterium]|nr:hypothetical protein [Oscillospiraceae bacterium]
MSARELIKEIEIERDGATELYRVRKMDAFSGSALLKTILAKFLPVVQQAEDFYKRHAEQAAGEPTEEQQETLNREATQLILKMAPPLLENLTDDELRSLMVRCLQFTDKKLKAGWVQVVDKSRHFAVDDVEYDLPLCLNLCVQSAMFSCSGFFGGNGLNLPSIRQNSSPQSL